MEKGTLLVCGGFAPIFREMTDALLRNSLLALHGALVESERRAYEKTHGRLGDGEFLQALVREPALAWLAPFTSLVARFDEIDSSKDALAQRRTWRARLRALLVGKNDFSARYAARIDASPEVAFAHAAALHALKESGR